MLFPILLSAQPAESIYRGLRVSLYGFKVVEQTDKIITVKCNAVNTGREPVIFGKNKKPPQVLIVELDTLALPAAIAARTVQISRAFLQGKVNLSPGQFQQQILLKIATDPLRMLEPEPEEKTEDVAPLPPADIAENASTASKKQQKNKPKPEKVQDKPAPSPPTPEPAAVVVATPELMVPVEEVPKEEGKCMDLVFDTVYISSQKSKEILVHFRIKNQGDKSANLLGEQSSFEDNLAINVYFVSGTKLTRGAFLAETIFYKNKSLPKDGKLAPGAIFEGMVNVNTKNRNRFNPNLIIEIDPFQTLPDCDKTNNTFSILIGQ